MNVRTEAAAIARASAWVAATLVGAALVTACGAQGDAEADASAVPQVVETDASAEPSVAAGDAQGSDVGAQAQPLADDEDWIDTYVFAFTFAMDPEPDWRVDGKILEFIFPSGDVAFDGTIDCMAGLGSFGTDHPDWGLKMTYPDGSVLCSEVES
jgi:hypothetical protein